MSQINEKSALDTAPAGSIRFNTDSSKMEIYNGEQWWNIDSTSPEEQTGGTRGILYAGATSSGRDDVIQFIQIETTGDAVDFGDATNSCFTAGGCASRTRGLFHQGENIFTELDFVTIASKGNATDFGDVTSSNGGSMASNSTRAIDFIAGGVTIESITIAQTGNSVDFGDKNYSATGTASCGSPTRAVVAGGYGPSPYPQYNNIEYVTIPTAGNAVDFGNLTFGHSNIASCSNATRGLIAGGYTFPSPATTYYNTIEFITLSSSGNATDFGDLTSTGTQPAGVSSPIRAVFAGRSDGGGEEDVIDFVSIMTTGNAVDFGNLLAGRRNIAPASNGHGGLG
tara:strand:- start:22 stop:1041 length:1020 start_codon:yes stop_codon:yes gene_type:complete